MVLLFGQLKESNKEEIALSFEALSLRISNGLPELGNLMKGCLPSAGVDLS